MTQRHVEVMALTLTQHVKGSCDNNPAEVEDDYHASLLSSGQTDRQTD